MIGLKCKHIETGHIGRIIDELNNTEKFPEQWGIFWFGGNEGKEHGDMIKNVGLLNYWQNKSEIIIINK